MLTGKAGLVGERPQPVGKAVADAPAGARRARARQDVHRRRHGRALDGVGVVGAGVRIATLGDHTHDLAAAADRRDRKAATQALSERRQVRDDAEPFLSAAPGKAESGDDLVEDQKRAVRAGLLTQKLQVAGLGQDAAGVEHARAR